MLCECIIGAGVGRERAGCSPTAVALALALQVVVVVVVVGGACAGAGVGQERDAAGELYKSTSSLSSSGGSGMQPVSVTVMSVDVGSEK